MGENSEMYELAGKDKNPMKLRPLPEGKIPTPISEIPAVREYFNDKIGTFFLGTNDDGLWEMRHDLQRKVRQEGMRMGGKIFRDTEINLS